MRMHVITGATVAGLLGAAALGIWAPAHSLAGAQAATEAGRYCGTDHASGLAVWAGASESCATALQVAGAYTKAASGTADPAATVRAGGVSWKCQERQGDPNPYQECVNEGDSSRRVILSS